MKTTSNRKACRYKEQGEGTGGAKEKMVFKLIQVGLASLMNTTLFAILSEFYLSNEIMTRLLQVFVIVFVSVITSNMLALLVVKSMFSIQSMKAFISAILV